MKSVHHYFASLPRPVGKRLFVLGWLLFLTSLYLPAMRMYLGCAFGGPSLLYGWDCAQHLFQYLGHFLSHFTPTYWMNFYPFVSALTLCVCAAGNIGAFFAPLLLKQSLVPSLLRWRTTFFALVTLSAMYQCIEGFSGCCVGYFVWTASFGMLAAGSLILASRKASEVVPEQATATYHPRTSEEMAAERELKEYLRLHG